ncbi:MAG TPA: hypothetical protein VHC48_00930, partial [Puia sp.]|nr:hypothetical protein [Puia sp.]
MKKYLRPMLILLVAIASFAPVFANKTNPPSFRLTIRTRLVYHPTTEDLPLFHPIPDNLFPIHPLTTDKPRYP